MIVISIRTPHSAINLAMRNIAMFTDLAHKAAPTRVKSGRNALFLPDFQFRFNLTLLQPNIP